MNNRNNLKPYLLKLDHKLDLLHHNLNHPL